MRHSRFPNLPTSGPLHTTHNHPSRFLHNSTDEHISASNNQIINTGGTGGQDYQRMRIQFLNLRINQLITGIANQEEHFSNALMFILSHLRNPHTSLEGLENPNEGLPSNII